jgi:hypothetical protein
MEEDFDGFDFVTDPKSIVVVNTNSVVYDDGSGLTGDFSEIDNYFNDEMVASDNIINEILSTAV